MDVLRPSMRRGLAALGGIALVLGLGAVVLAPRSSSSLSHARDLVEQSSNFATGIEAGNTLAHVSELLLDEAGECDQSVATCQALHASAAFAQVLAARALVCTAPGRAEARAKMADVLSSVAAGETPELPVLPTCG